VTKPAILLVTDFFLVCLAFGQLGITFENMMTDFLASSPIQLSYYYALSDGRFSQDMNGTMVLIEPGKFRLDLWDKIYSSDGSSLYLYDRNTRQTVIDSLRWSDVNLWVRLLQGDLPAGTVSAHDESPPPGIFRFELLNEELQWVCTVDVDTSTRAIQEIMLKDDQGWEHLVRLQAPTPWNGMNLDSVLALKDLPGLRLDLR